MTTHIMQNVLSNSGKLRLRMYLKNADSMGWVLVWWRYMTQQLLTVQKDLSFTLQWRQLNCMTISQYAINFVDISLGFCGWINWQVILSHGLIRHNTLPAEPYHASFYYASWQW